MAASTLVRVWHEGAFASAALNAELRRRAMTGSRDGSLATELVYGVLRTAAWLDRGISIHARDNRWQKQPLLRAHLLIASYSLRFLDRVPAFAAVDQAVGAIRQAKGARVAGFANAVLRKLAREHEQAPRVTSAELLLEAMAETPPRWLRAALADALGGRDAARHFITAGPLPPPTCLCVHGKASRERWLARLREAAPTATFANGALSPRCIAVRGAGDLAELPGHSSEWHQQEEGAQIVALAVGAQPGDEVLDACAGRGGKTMLLAERVGDDGAVDAADSYPRKLEQLAARTGSGGVRSTFAVDWTLGSGQIVGGYDRVLVDAPCSGVGTLRRRPEIAGRLTATDVTRLATLQLNVARGAARHVRPGGRLVYAVCSVLQEECEQVVEALTASPAPGDPRPLLVPAPFDSEVGRQIAGAACSFRLLPQVHGTDGFFVASLLARRRV